MSETPQLRVNRQQLAEGLQLVARVKGLGQSGGVWTYAGGQLSVIFGGLAFEADAQGDWRGALQIKAPDMRRLGRATFPPVADVELRFTDGQLQLLVDQRTVHRYDAKWIPTDE